MSEEIVIIGKRKRFTLKEARDMLPVIKNMTSQAAKKIQSIAKKNDVGHINEADDDVQQQVHQVVQSWATNITSLGCVPNGIWLVDFDNGQGYFCWQYGEDDVDHYHAYDTGFASRTAIN